MILSHLPSILLRLTEIKILLCISVSVQKNAPLFLNSVKFKTYSSSVFHFKVFHLSHNKTSNKNHSPSSHRISISSKRWKLIPFYFELMIWEARIKFCLVNAQHIYFPRLFKSFEFGDGSSMSDAKIVLLEFKYLQNKKRQKKAVKSTRKKNSYRTYLLFSFHSDN